MPALPSAPILAQRRDLRLGDAGHSERLDKVIDLARRHTLDPGFLDDGGECLLRRLARLQEGREVGALAQLGDLQVQRAEPGIQLTRARAVAVGGARVAALMPGGADQRLDLEVHQPVQRVLGDGAQEIAIRALLDLLDQCHSVVGHRGVLGRDRVLQLDPTKDAR